MCHAAECQMLILSCVRLFVTPRTAACQAPLDFTISQNVLELMSIELVMLSKHLNLCCSYFSFVFNCSQNQGLYQ